ncbi:AraC family transcriptional regulator [Rhizobium miluonense]|uniref:AraC-type DNA-binding protein n=1 Tax=Rhizobium miluonense TaxID=411945 RepID=A0A1C3U5Y1_9HYPH|nr:AraC family transcriptional regulator [Rhizobium miluonense]SCB10873.1 AraC-type DNA-binding protein [Rhizobium miluonense]
MATSLIEYVAKAERFEPALADRTISIGRFNDRWLCHLILSTTGKMRLTIGEDSLELVGSTFLLLPPSAPARLTSGAGTRIYVVGISLDMMADALGNYPETSALKLFIEAPAQIEGLPDNDAALLETYFANFVAERHYEGESSLMALTAHLRLILLSAWRLCGSQQSRQVYDGGTVLQRFRQLVEAEFRRHRPISHYAEQLGIKQDRLHDICRRNLDWTPLELVHERLAQDARLRLERFGGSVREISDYLGFRDPAAFSHFFKRRMGVSPAQYRELYRSGKKGAEFTGSTEYYDWP